MSSFVMRRAGRCDCVKSKRSAGTAKKGDKRDRVDSVDFFFALVWRLLLRFHRNALPDHCVAPAREGNFMTDLQRRPGARCLAPVLAWFLFGAASAALAAVSHDTHLRFDGVNDVATITANLAPSPSSQVTIEAWVQPTTIASTTNQDRVVSKSGAYELTISTGDTGCGFGTQGDVQFRATIGGVDARICGGTLLPGAWHRIVGTYDGAQFALYVDGVRAASVSRSGAISVNSAPLTFGNRPALDRPFDGALDEVRIWSRALTAAELQANDRPLTGSEPNLLAYYRIDSGSGQTLLDSAASARHGALGATSAAETSDPTWAQGGSLNTAPSADAGPDQSFLWPTATTSLFGTAQDDGLPSSTLSYLWVVTSGPGAVSFQNPTTPQTSATFSAPGVYVLTLEVSDGELTAIDQVEVRVISQQAAIATLEVRPRFVTLGPNETQAYTILARDTNGAVLNVQPTWSASAGTITSMGIYTAPASAGLRTITATVNGVSARATADVKAAATLWPAVSWTIATPASQNMNATLLAQARDYALTYGGAGMIVRGGRQVLAWGNVATRYDVKSTTKSIGGTALGLAMLDGSVDVGDFAQMHLPAVGLPPSSNTSTGWLDDLTLLHLATHTSGFDKPGGYIPLLFAPGTQWAYSDGGANWLADALTKVFNSDLNSVLLSRALTPIGVTSGDFLWRANAYRDDLLDGVKRREFGAGIRISANAMARIGYLYLRRGVWAGQRILPDEFAELVQHPQPSFVGKPSRDPANFPQASNHYGVLWWTNADSTLPEVPRDAHWAWGLGDSLIIVIPSLDLVAVRAGNGFGRSNWNANYDVLAPFINPIVRAASPKIAVPNVTNRTQTAATSTIIQAGLAVASVTQQRSTTIARGNVITQTPTAATMVARNSGVRLTVSSGP
jgi:CubicO group peptidase (beta-lactamase class C family)